MLDLYALSALKSPAELPNCKSAPKLSDLTNRKIRSTFSDWLTGLFTTHSLASNERQLSVSILFMQLCVIGHHQLVSGTTDVGYSMAKTTKISSEPLSKVGA